ncbi:LysR family transcriptional regulator [Parasedimentitalea maritima]|uniref:LysR family transcriptional regulator n=2 Tax=Parasedimentitalea maritima TaxID=2578117 RepID=A0A6A4RLG0_9RHOB|nr:LysR family transcriptional regulator [Zongyanglinia marina]
MPVSPPRPKQLPMTALRAFETAARLGGFAAAAQELGISPGAVSAHVKTLEDSLRAPLFLRSAKGVTLTALGLRVLPDFTAAFDQMGQAMQLLHSEAAPQVVHIAALPAVAQFWLSPRLPALRAAAPDIEISITAMETPPNLKRAPYDLCLFYEAALGDEVAKDGITPVCAPSFADQLRSPADLQHVPCLSDSSWSKDWDHWLNAACPDAAITPRGPEFSLYALAVEETVNGAGVLIGHTALIERQLNSGALVAPFETVVSLPLSLRLWSPRRHRRGSPAGQVARWLTGAGRVPDR